MKPLLLLGSFLLLPPLQGGDDEVALKPLEGALWHGRVTLHVQGPHYTQFLANFRNEDGRAVFVKEKGEMNVDLTLEIECVVNAVGEYELLAQESFQGDYILQRQSRSQFQEEMVQKRVRFKQKVYEAVARKTAVRFETTQTYDRASFDLGTLRLLPSGRLDKKGSILMSGDFTFTYNGGGEFTETRERQPLSEADPNTKVVGDVKKTYTLPLKFEFKTDLHREPVSGKITLTSDVKNPFPIDEKSQGKSTYRNALKLEGSFHFTPLFSKK